MSKTPPQRILSSYKLFNLFSQYHNYFLLFVSHLPRAPAMRRTPPAGGTVSISVCKNNQKNRIRKPYASSPNSSTALRVVASATASAATPFSRAMCSQM